MNRYLKAFSLTLFLYVFALIGFFYLDAPVKLYVDKSQHIVSLQHLSFLEQKEVKKVVEKTKVEKRKPKERKEEKKERVQKEKVALQKSKSIPLNEKPIKKKVVKKRVVKKEPIKKVEEVKEKLVKEEPKKIQQAHKLSQVSYEEEFNKHHLKEIIRLIQKNMKYPRRARSLNIQGEVVVEFTLLQDGNVSEFKALQGHKLLKKSAIKAIKKAALSFPKVKKSLRLKVPIVFRLS